MITAKLLEIDKPTSRGIIYPRATVEKALKECFERLKLPRMAIFDHPTMNPIDENIVGEAENFRIEDGILVADVGFYKDKMDKVADDKEIITIRPNGVGSVDPETMMIDSNYSITGLCIRHSPRK